jgi:hypothetical protein
MICIMRIRLFPVLLALALSQSSLAQRDPRPGIQSNLPPPQPPPQLSTPPSLITPRELPIPTGRQCMKEVAAPCKDDPKRECKTVVIAACD